MEKKKTLVIGLGISGRSAARFLLKKGEAVVAVDRSVDKMIEEEEIAQLCSMGLEPYSDEKINLLDQCNRVIKSPGISPSHPFVEKAKEKKIEVIGEMELGCKHLKNKMIGITGTNGKTTVTMMIAHVLNKCGKKAELVGNIGVPMTSLLEEKNPSLFVTELSSFQLESLRTPALSIAMILNLSQDHLDRYKTYEDYVEAKMAIQKSLKPEGKFFINEDIIDPWGLFITKPAFSFQNVANLLFPEDKKVAALPYLRYRKLTGYQRENLLAAFAVCYEMGVSSQEFLEALPSFVKPPHRLEHVKDFEGVSYYNDSKATNAEAVEKAVEYLNKNIILIAGGQEKMLDYSRWQKTFPGKVKGVCLIGETAKQLEGMLKSQHKVYLCKSLEEALSSARKLADRGDNVLLSPGSASFDMFNNFAHRGDEFKRMVHELS